MCGGLDNIQANKVHIRLTNAFFFDRLHLAMIKRSSFQADGKVDGCLCHAASREGESLHRKRRALWSEIVYPIEAE